MMIKVERDNVYCARNTKNIIRVVAASIAHFPRVNRSFNFTQGIFLGLFESFVFFVGYKNETMITDITLSLFGFNK